MARTDSRGSGGDEVHAPSTLANGDLTIRALLPKFPESNGLVSTSRRQERLGGGRHSFVVRPAKFSDPVEDRGTQCWQAWMLSPCGGWWQSVGLSRTVWAVSTTEWRQCNYGLLCTKYTQMLLGGLGPGHGSGDPAGKSTCSGTSAAGAPPLPPPARHHLAPSPHSGSTPSEIT